MAVNPNPVCYENTYITFTLKIHNIYIIHIITTL